jgi:hypothetical protein
MVQQRSVPHRTATIATRVLGAIQRLVGRIDQYIFVGVATNDQELFTTQAAHPIILACGTLNHFSDFLEHDVADCMAMVVVDLFKVVDVYQQHGQWLAGSISGIPCLRQGMHARTPVGQFGELIRQRDMLQAAMADRQIGRELLELRRSVSARREQPHHGGVQQRAQYQRGCGHQQRLVEAGVHRRTALQECGRQRRPRYLAQPVDSRKQTH